MATPTTPEARLYAAGAKKGSVWGTEVALGATHEIKLLKSPDLPKALKQDYLMLKESNNTYLSRGIAGGVSGCDFTPEAYMRYNPGPLGEFLAEVFGTAGAPSGSAPVGYTHTFQWAASSLGLFSTYAEEYPGLIYSAPSAKPVKIVFSLQDGILKIAPTLRGNTIINNSAVNGATQMDALTPIDAANEIRFDQLSSVWMAAYPHDDALDVEDAKTISGFEITYQRGLESAKMTSGATSLAEAQEEDFSDIRVKLDFPYDDSFNRQFFANYTAGSCYSLQMSFVGGVIATSYHYQLNLYFPKLRLAALPDLTKSGLVKVTAEFQDLDAGAAVTGFTYQRNYLTLVNDRSTNYLA